MSNYEIIEKFESDKVKSSLDVAGGVFVETDLVHEIVKALEQQPCEDAISRPAAIEALSHMCSEDEKGITVSRANVDSMLRYLPSAQPERLTDKEQRIFLAAMGKEEKVCKQVDDECRDCREVYEDSLVRTCHEIVRKIKGALWT